MRRSGACSGCCVRLTDCEACRRCIPRFLCASFVVTPSLYTSLQCCNENTYNQGQFSLGLTYDCSSYRSAGGSWTASGACPGLTDITVEVWLEVIGSDCYTYVSVNDSEPVSFLNVLPAGEMTGTYTNDLGDIFEWEIESASTVQNPLAFDMCAPCRCTTCLPRKLCVQVALSELNPAASIFASGLASAMYTYDCDTRTWVGPSILGTSITIALKDASEQLCGINVDASGYEGEASGVIMLEAPADTCIERGIICQDSRNLLMTIHKPQIKEGPGCDHLTEIIPHEWVSSIDSSFDLVDYDGNVTGIVTIRDAKCGDCVVCAQDSVCCGNVLDGTITTLQVSASGCKTKSFTLTLNESAQNWQGEDEMGQVYTLSCDAELVGDEFVSTWTFSVVEIPAACTGLLVMTTTAISCDPLELIFDVGTYGGACDEMNPCIHNTRFVITL